MCQASPKCRKFHRMLGALLYMWEPGHAHHALVWSRRVTTETLALEVWAAAGGIRAGTRGSLWACCGGGMGTGAAQDVGSSPGSLRGRLWHALLLLLWFWLAPAWGSGSSLLPRILRQWGVTSSVTGLKSLTSPWGSFILWKTGWRRVSPQKPQVQHKRHWKVGSSHTVGDVTVLGYKQGV